MSKGPDAFRTISEVAEELDLPQHVLRFWETRFTQIKPMKRGGGRRYYRPDDVDLLRGIRRLLYGEGYTIKGVQRILREQGVRRVAALADGGHLDALPAAEPDEADDFGADDLIDDGSTGDLDDDIPSIRPQAPEPRSSFFRPRPREERREPGFGPPRHYPETPPLVRATRQGGGDGRIEPDVPAGPSPRIPQAPPDLETSADDFLPPLVADAPSPPQRDPHPVRSVPEPEESRFEPAMDGTGEKLRRAAPRSAGLSPEALDQLQVALIELLECKRILDQTR